MTTTRSSRATAPVAAMVAALVLMPALSVSAGQKKPPPHAVVAGTVFRDPGFALVDADVVLMLKNDVKTKKLQQVTSNYRGEFAFEVPANSATYVVKASRKGYRPEQKEVMVSGEERIEVTLSLVAESK